MTKSSGLGHRLIVGGYDLSGDVNSPALSGGPALLVDTGIDKFAFERLGGVRDGSLGCTAFFNPGPEADAAHAVLSLLPRTDIYPLYCCGSTAGVPAACVPSKQVNYDGTRGDDGAFTFAVSAQANGFGLEWGNLITPVRRTDTAATTGASYDTGAAHTHGLQAYLQVGAFTGTDATVKVQDSADNVTFADLAGGAFTTITAGRQAQRIQTGRTATVRRYLRAVTTTTGGFTSLVLTVMANVNTVETRF
ncbi:hypothetical protein [Streptomyces sp. CA-111067]|uniref:hypothetical protein n=1 Tax=Streptomyces sp. CA-111067 TaxID=3240046 RepID=UPI003D95CECF